MKTLRRLRLVFVLVSLLLLVPIALLVRKALASIEIDRAMRHRAVAERVIDEMERELSAWLRREEDRPYAHYRYFFVPDGGTGGSLGLTRSPLAEPASEPFVVGYFQVDPDGTVSSPRWPGNEALAENLYGWQLDRELQAEVASLRQAIVGLWTSTVEPPVAITAQSAGTTIAVGQRKIKTRLSDEQTAAESDPLGALQRLNRGIDARGKRAAKVEESDASNVYNFARDEDNLLQQSVIATRRPAAADEGEEAGRGQDLASSSELRQEIQEALDDEASPTVAVRLEPMVGRSAAADLLVLYRTVTIGEKAYRQGVAVDVPRLIDWLAERVLPDRSATAASISRATDTATTTTAGYAYLHRFAEPFAAVSSRVTLTPLPELAGTLYLYTLAALLGLASTVGLYALYRMVAVVVSFAERRQNFVSAVTHELKTPLTAIRMYGEMLRDGMVPSEDRRQRYYEIVTAEAERLGRLLTNVLELSRLERQDRPVDLTVGDVAGVADEVLKVLRPHADKEGFELRLEVEPALPAASFDRDALKQVLFNLIDNAIKYSRKSARKEVVISCRRDEKNVRLTVADHGPGVAQEHLQRIFEPFYRAGDELTRTAEGTGIGLALVRGLVERMDGRVTGRNGHPHGFEVTVELEAAG